AYRGVDGAPRRFSFPTGYNIKTSPDRDGRVSFETLKRLIDNYSVARACIQHRIDDVRSLEYSIQPRDDNVTDADNAITAAYAAMRHPDGVHSFRAWLAMYLEDVLRYDAGCLIKQRDRLGRYCGLQVVSGMTMAPKLDEWGNRPSGNATAFQQYNEGLPWMDFTADQVIYEPFRPQPDSVYGLAPLEAVMLTANTHMRYQQYWLQWFTEGTVPGGFATLPESINTPDQIRQYQEYYDDMHAGNVEEKHEIEFMPHGTVFEWPKDGQFNSDFALFLMREVCAAYGVTPNDLGWTEDVNRATGDTQVDVQFRIGTLPLIQHVQDIINGYLQDDLGLPVKFEFDTGQESEDRLATAQSWVAGITVGAVSADEMRQEVYGMKIDNDRPIPRGLISARAGFIPWEAILAVAGPIDPETMAPVDTQPLALLPYNSIDGVMPQKIPGAANFTRDPINPDDPQFPSNEGVIESTGTIASTTPIVAKAAGGVDELLKLELAQFRAFTKARAKTGRWRDFRFTVLNGTDAARLNADARQTVVKASADADPKVPEVGTPKWRQQNANPTPQQLVDLPLTDYWSPQVKAGLMDLWSATDLAAARTATDGLGDVANGVYQQAVRQVLAGNVNNQNLTNTVKSLWSDAYSAGAMSARAQVTGIPVNLDTWKPGLPESLAGTSAQLQAELDRVGVTIDGITSTTMDRIGNVIANSVNAGASIEDTANSINDVLNDPNRAELIAHTETARMLNMAAMSTYEDLNATLFDLVISEGACEICEEAADQNPHRLDDDDAQVPLHPRC